MNSERSFSELLGLHHRLDQLLADHQQELISGHIADAAQLWHDFAKRLDQHATDEEVHLLPLYGERVDIPLGGTVELFLSEHTKIRKYLSEISEYCKQHLATGQTDPVHVVWMIERQYQLKQLLEHHDSREEMFLYPLLDAQTTPEERLVILRKVLL